MKCSTLKISKQYVLTVHLKLSVADRSVENEEKNQEDEKANCKKTFCDMIVRLIASGVGSEADENGDGEIVIQFTGAY